MNLSPRLPARSLGLKFIVILALIILMGLPVMFISIISYDRSSRANDVTYDVSQTYGGAQTVMGPVLVIPYEKRLTDDRITVGDYVVSPEKGDAVFENVSVSEKTRSLYKVPVFTATGTLSGEFAPLSEIATEADGVTLFPERAKIVIGIQDVTGLQSDVTLKHGANATTFEPYQATGFSDITRQVEAAIEPNRMRDREDGPDIYFDRLQSAGLTLLSVKATDILSEDSSKISVSLSLSGAPSFSVLPYARSTEFSLSSDWPHPGFEGRFPPSDRTISENGFEAQWRVPYLRRGLPAAGPAADMNTLLQSGQSMQVNFVSPLNPYQTVNRALKYAILFIGLVFLAYFLMETLLTVRVHPAQYLLIGLAQAVFYLLLLAFAERFGFTLSFMVSAIATVALTALYAGAVFGRSLIAASAGVFGLVYGLLFVLMRIQDFALMVGALVCFIAIAATLYLTRNLNWYGDAEN